MTAVYGVDIRGTVVQCADEQAARQLASVTAGSKVVKGHPATGWAEVQNQPQPSEETR